MPDTELENIKEHPRVKEMLAAGGPDRVELQEKATEATPIAGLSAAPPPTAPPPNIAEPERKPDPEPEPESESPKVVPTLSDLAVQVETLKKLLAAEELATLRATRAASDYREQFTEAQADLAGMKSRWYASEKARKAAASQREGDASSIQLQRVQKELERARAAHKVDMDQAAAKQRSLERKVEEVESAADTAQTASARKGRLRNQMAAAVAVLALGACGAMAFRQTRSLPDPGGASSTETASYSTAPVRSAAHLSSTKLPAQGASRTPRAPSKPFVPRGVTTDLPKAMDRLSQALAEFPGEEPQAVLHEISVRQSKVDFPVCSFDWVNGEPSMVFGKADNRNGNMSEWAKNISRCADAVEQAH